jgi:GTP-dependent phosphoenolpyruvate carboxykinase
MQKDDFQSEGFQCPEDTEIPQLQQHTRKLTEAGRRSHCRRFLNDLSQLLNSMKLWVASGVDEDFHAVDKEHLRKKEELLLREQLETLQKVCVASISQQTMRLTPLGV